MKILVCDDQQAGFEAARQRIPTDHEVIGLCEHELTNALRALFAAISRLLHDGKANEPHRLDPFAGFDVAIVDNNLTELEFEGARLSAETIIGYMRAFTDIPYVVSLNKNPDVDFDLRYLFGDYQSRADLAINTDHLSNERLWQSGICETFAPWYWPCLPDAASRRRSQVRFVGSSVDEPIWTALGFPNDAIDYLSYRAKTRLASNGSPTGASFRDFFAASQVLIAGDTLALGDLASQGHPAGIEALCRVTAADVDRWLRRDVLGPQDVLIDTPHLLARMPFLLERVTDLHCWNRAVWLSSEPFGMKQDVYRHHVDVARFDANPWHSSPWFWWPILSNDGDLGQLFFDSQDDWPDAVFCEDTSSFVAIPSGEGGGPAEFEAEFEGTWPRRYISGVEGKRYVPRTRLLT